jgi:uncharacterized protein YgfB (UPF0149 family)
MHQTNVDYRQLQRRLQGTGLACDPSWLHGALFGLIALHDDRHQAPCEGLAGALQGLEALEDEVGALYHDTWDSIDGPGLDFGMLLPPESEARDVRARGVISWTRGFLDGLRCGGVDAFEFPDDSGPHAIGELRELAQTEAAELSGDEDELHEAMEHAWVTAVLVRELLVVARERRAD